MIYPAIEKFRVVKAKDVLLRNIQRKKQMSTIIEIAENPEEDTYQCFMVEAVGREVDSVKVGEIVICDWRRVTAPFKLSKNGNTVSCGLTDQKELSCVLEGAVENEL